MTSIPRRLGDTGEEDNPFLGVDRARHGNPPIGTDVRWQRPG